MLPQKIFNINTKDIIVKEEIYPRKQKSKITIDNYKEAMESGAIFPALLLQKVTNEKDEEIILLDGYHRLEAYKGLKQSEVGAIFWKEEILDFKANVNNLRIESIKRNLEHGDRLSNSDKQSMCQLMAEEDPQEEITYDIFCDLFKVSKGTVSNWISDIRVKQKGSRNGLIFRYDALGYTQQEIAEKLGLGKSQISEILGNSDLFNSELIGKSYQEGKKVYQIAEYNGLDILTTWHILLKEKNDLDRFAEFGKEDKSLYSSAEVNQAQPKIYNYWNFSKRDIRLGQPHPGLLWGQHIMNILYFFSKQGDLILDPMAGGGVTIDACLIMGRKCRAYDINPKRDDIEQRNVLTGFPENIKKADLIIWDPPYYKMKEKEYSCEEFTKDRQTYLNSIEKVLQHCSRQLKEKKFLAFIMMNYMDYNNPAENIFMDEYFRIFSRNGFAIVLEIQTPLNSDAQYHSYDISRSKEKEPWQILNLNRSWIIFQKN